MPLCLISMSSEHSAVLHSCSLWSSKHRAHLPIRRRRLHFDWGAFILLICLICISVHSRYSTLPWIVTFPHLRVAQFDLLLPSRFPSDNHLLPSPSFHIPRSPPSTFTSLSLPLKPTFSHKLSFHNRRGVQGYYLFNPYDAFVAVHLSLQEAVAKGLFIRETPTVR